MAINVSIPTPSVETLTNNLTFPGLNPLIEKFNSTENELINKVNSLSSATDGIASSISSIKSQLEPNLNTLKSQFGTMLADIEIPTSSLQGDIFNALKLSSTNPAGFASEIQAIASKYPSTDMDSLVSKFSSASFSIAQDIPNIKIINGQEILKALPEIKPTKAVETLSEYTEVEKAEVPDLETRIKVMTDLDKKTFDNITEESLKSDIFPTDKLENIRSSMENKIRESVQDLIALTDSMNRTGRKSGTDADELITKFANEKRLLITMAGRTRDRNLSSGSIEEVNSEIPKEESI